MKICVVGSSKRFFSGITTHTIFLANALAKRGHEVSVVTLRNLVPLFLYPGRKRVGEGEYLVDFAPEIKVYDGMDWNSPRTWLGATRFLKLHEPNAVIMLWWSSSVAHLQFMLALGSRLSGRPRLILEMHEVVDALEETIFPIRLYSRLAGRLLFKFFDAYTTPSEEVNIAVVSTYGMPVEKVSVVPIGIYEQYAVSEGVKTSKEKCLDSFVILCFGMIRRYKGVPVLLDAFEMLPEEVAHKATLFIVGEDWGNDPTIRPLIERSKYREKIVYRPDFVPDADVPKYFADADVVVLPYLRTCGSGVAHIAVANGRPIITADLPVMQECLCKYDGVAYFPPGDAVSLADRLIEAYGDWLENGTKSHFSPGMPCWDEIAQRYEAIICNLPKRL